ncbi:MAG: hypothetical protein RLZZ408_1155 [Verrucomicrobiota bacterium]|jgi:ribosome maturation factor RimP
MVEYREYTSPEEFAKVMKELGAEVVQVRPSTTSERDELAVAIDSKGGLSRTP